MWYLSKIEHLLLILDLIFVHIAGGSYSKVHYITPSPNTQCPTGESCLTLSMLSANISNFLDSNTALIFLAGNHTLDLELYVSNIDEFLRLSTNVSVAASVTCSGNASFKFINITQMQICGLEFIGCSSKVESVDQFSLEDSSFHGGNGKPDGSVLELTQTNTNIIRSSFTSNKVGTYQNHVGFLEMLNFYNLHHQLNIQSYSARVGGALVVTSSNLTISSSHFDGNTAELGGAIFSELGSNITISNCTFVSNSVTGCSDDHCNGGALFIDSGCTFTAHNCTFINNTSGFSGGAIALFNGTYFDSQNVFSNNEASHLGGALSAYNSSRINTNYSCYNNNLAGYDGGVMYMFSRSSVAVDNSFFGNNEAEDDGGVIVAQKGSKITVDNSLCDENTAGRNGGVMYAHSSSSITVNNSFFGNNRAGNYGGVMYARESSNITVDDSSFDNNDAGSGGGVMFTNISSSITVDNSSFDNNTATRDGGAMAARHSSNITVDNSSFDNNEAGNDGGAMSAHSNSSITVDNSSFENNEAGSGGGAMSALVGSSITADNSSFYSNEAGLYGGAVCVYFNSSITVDKSSFDNNYSRNYGGGMYAHSNSSITVDNSSFDNNEARGNGGVMAAGASSNITVDNSSFDNNIANRDGGVIFAQAGGNVTVDNSSFDNNEARNDGGVMVAYNSSITVDNSSFDNNEAGNGGVMHVHEKSNITVENSSFDSNKAGIFGGVVATYSGCKVTVDNSSFDNNGAGSYGGVMVAYNSSITVDNSSFDNNEAGTFGGVMATYSSSNVTVDNSSFDNNEADDDGGVMFAHSSSIIVGNSFFNNSEAGNDGGVIIAFLRGSITVDSSSFVNNEAGGNGGVMIASDSSSITVDNSYFDNNEAGDSGGVIAMFTSNFLTVTESTFIFNNANRGGAIYLQTGNSLTINNSNFIHNSANTDGGVIYSGNQNRLILSNNKLNFNRADNNGGVVCSLIQTKLAIIGDKSIFIGNQGHSGGVVFARKSKVSVHSQTLLMANNTAEDTGGAIHLSKANLTFFTGGNRLIRNQAGHGGAIYARKSRLVIETNSLTEISANLAMNSGGGMYLVMSKLNIRGNSSYITGNKVNKIGGGLHAANSRIIIEGTLHFTNNEAENGGGVSLERYSKLHGVSATNDIINFTSNRASHRGGALYVDDETNPDMCTAVATQNATSTTECFSALVSINFSDNSAGLAGPNLFGGLLDRCTLHTDFSNETEVVRTGATSFQRFSSISKPHLDTISSYPVRLCFCRDSQPDCDNLPENIQIDRRKTFSIELIAYDQVSNAVNATVDCSLNSSAGGLGESQVVQHISETCTEFHFNIFSPRKYEDLILSMRGSCDVPEFSERSVRIEITCTCPIGFQLANNDEVSCDCVCDRVLQPYDKTECNSTTQSIIRKENFWISYANSSGLIVYPNCPFDYCHPPRAQVSVNLNLPSGSDAQCASNRSGTLCGTCKPGLSVSLGSSRCLHCPTYWPGLLVMIVILFILSGVGLVALLLVLNLTVAVGTLNAIIFYANIVAANRIALFSTSDVSFASVFISWINFDLGIDICFYSGMNTYIKTWLQLAFPIYMFFLVGVIVGLCRYFDAFGHLIGRKDPVATLATLILLSNAKFITLLQTIITTLVPATLSDYYPDGSNKYVWLPDGTVDYLSSKHIILFFTAIIILPVSYTHLTLPTNREV